jgi:pyruvate dehydrogenase E2 component (dihydrolipoamide acetyltransferase)
MADFTMPRLGADMEEATLVQWRVQPGDPIRRGQVIADVDTTKGVIEIECFDSGVVDKLVAREGETLPVGAVLAVIQSDAKEAATTEADSPGASSTDAPRRLSKFKAESKTTDNLERATPDQQVGEAHRRRVTPLARRLAGERGVDLSRVVGTGAHGEVTAADIEKLSTAAATSPADRFRPTSADENRARLRMAIAGAMAKSKREIPHYYLQSPIDMSRALTWLERENENRPIAKRLLPIVLSLKALALALREVPQLNGHWFEGRLRNSDSVHIGFAIAMKGGGLVAPAIHDVDRKSLNDIMAALNELIPRARTGPLRSSEMTDATITLTNLGDLGVASVFGVIYPPQVAIVGLGRILSSPWVDDGQLVVRPLMQACLSGDHRATDGQTGSRLLGEFNRHLQSPERL